jgi:hypothetical protein
MSAAAIARVVLTVEGFASSHAEIAAPSNKTTSCPASSSGWAASAANAKSKNKLWIQSRYSVTTYDLSHDLAR